jgi:hypothetical protein
MPLADAIGRADQSFVTTVGESYSLTYDVLALSGDGANTIYTVYLGTTQGGSDLGTQVVTSTGSKSKGFTATTATTWVRFETDNEATTGPAAVFRVDNVSVLGTETILVTEGGLAQLIAGMSDSWEALRQVLATVGSIRDPYKTPILSDLEKEYGITTDTTISEADRRDKLAAVKYARAGTATIDDMQIALDRAFPDLFTVYDNDPAQNPSLLLSDNFLADGDMEQTAVTPPWVVGNSATLTKDVTDPKIGLRNLRVRRNLVDNPYAEQDALTVGETYRFTGWAKSDGNAFPSLRVGGQEIWQGTLSGDWEYFDETATVTASQLVRLTSVTSTGSEFTDWDQVSITTPGVLIVNGQIFDLYTDYVAACGETGNRIPDIDNGALCGEALAQCGENHGIVKSQLQYNFPDDAGYWPLIFFVGGQARYYSLLLDGDMERSDVAAWTVGGGASLTKETSDPKQGSRFLQVTNVGIAGDARQTILTVGNDYRVIGWYRSDGTATATIQDGSTVLANTTSTTWTKVDFEFTATATDFRLGKGTAGNIAEFDDFQVVPQYFIAQTECGEALAQCGEPDAYAGGYSGEIIGIDRVQVPENRQNDLERLILAVKPMHAWGLLFVEYV